MKRQIITPLVTIASIASFATLPASAAAASSSASADKTAGTNQATLNLIIQRGDTEITRRLASLDTLGSKVSSATKLSSSDQLALSNEVSSEVSGLTALKTKLDADTDVASARSDAQSIINDYRVYALIVPKVDLIKTADDQQATEAKLTALATKLQTRITADQTAGKNVTAETTSLTDLTTQVSAAQGISSGIETKVISLQPSDYDSDHSVLSGDRDQLKTAQSDLKTALSDAQSIVTGLKNLGS